jgi:thioredoxin 1
MKLPNWVSSGICCARGAHYATAIGLLQSRMAQRENPRIQANVDQVAGMTAPQPYLGETEAPNRAEVDTLTGLTLLEFGTDWCGHCRAAQPALAEVLPGQPDWRHLKVEDGPGRPLGRSFRVKLWPTLVLLRDGLEVARLVRPTQANAIRQALMQARA